MGTQTQTAPIQQQGSTVPRWSLASRVAFRFCFLYLGLFSLTTQIFGGLVSIPEIDVPDLSTLWPMRQIVLWTAAHIFRPTSPVSYQPTGSGDRTFDWVLTFCLLILAALATGAWSALDRKRENYVTLHKWFRLFLRFALAAQMISYGLAKVVPLQMPFPYLAKLVEPFGNFSPMGVLWASVGAAPAYEVFAGSAELLGGVLLIFPRTAMVGALVCLADTIQVFTLNMTYDVPVKLFSFHLILISLFLLAPELPRLADFFFRDRTVGPSRQPQLFRTRRANRIALALQVVFGIWLVASSAYGSWTGWRSFGGGRPQSPLYGIWNVDQLSVDGQPRARVATDQEQVRRVIFDPVDRMSLQHMDDSIDRYSAKIDVTKETVSLTKANDKNWNGTLHFQRPAHDQLTLDGDMDSRKVHMQLQLIDRNKFLLVNRGFHWVQEQALNR